MSRRLLLGSGAAALALVVALPSAALACEKDGDGAGHGAGSGRSAGSSEHGKKEHAKRHDSRSDAKSAGSGEEGHNPPGNNGTIKIDYAAPADSGHANRPHPGCAFQLRMFNFDDDQYGTITFVGQAPTKLGTLLTQTHVLLSDDAAGGGKDVDEVYAYTAQQLGLIGKPQAKQGWHIKVSVDAENAPGGAKHKVFWLKCEQAAVAGSGTSNGTATPSTTTSTTTGGTASGAATQGGSMVTTKSVDTTSTTATTSTVGTAGRAAAAARAAAGTAFTGGEASAATAPAAGTAASRGSALPFTGLGLGLGTMLLVALAALLAGGFAIRAGRRRTAARF